MTNGPSITITAKSVSGLTSMSWSSPRRTIGTTHRRWRRCATARTSYLEKPMTYTVDEAKEIADAVKASGRVLQVGSQYASMDHFWKARKAIKDGLLGEVVWASGGFGRNKNQRGEWNYAIDPEANEKTLDWKAFLGSAPKRPFDPERYFRWRKYWDYSGGIATDLVLSLGLAASRRDRRRVPAAGHLVGRHLHAEGSRGAGYVLHERRLSGLDDAAGVLGGERCWCAARHPRKSGNALHWSKQRKPDQHADGSRARSGVSRRVREEDGR